VSVELQIVTPSGEAFSDTVETVVLPGSEGRFGVLERHARFLAPLRPGAVEIHTGRGREWAAVSDGFADVSPERVTVLVDRCQLAADVDTAAASERRSELQSELAQLSQDEEDAPRRKELENELAVAEALLEVGGSR